MRYFEKEILYLVVGCDSNAHHSVWGSTTCNSRGEALVEFLNTTNMDILNRENEPTFCSGGRSEMSDNTLESLRFLESIICWKVSSAPSPSDHRYILFTLRGSVTVRLIRNHRGTYWSSFKKDLWGRLERGHEMDMKSEAGLGLAIHWVQQALILPYENNCPLRPVKTSSQSWKWTAELESLRRGVRRLFNACRSNKNPHSWDLYREAQRITGRLLRMLGGPSVALLMTYLGQSNYIGLFLGTLKLSWALWWPRRAGVRSPKRIP